MTVCGEKVTGVCVAGKCPYFKRCCPVVWDKYGKIKPKTNEEYLRSLNTEQLAEFLSNLPMRPCIVCPKWETYCRSHSGSPCWEDGNEYDLWNVWLKQPHQKE